MSETTVNGDPAPTATGTTVAAVVATLTTTPDGCAVAVNDDVVPRSSWSARIIEAGDRVEVLTAVQGG